MKIKDIKSWPFEQKAVWIMGIANSVYSYFNDVSVIRVVFFQGLWALVIDVFMKEYLKSYSFKKDQTYVKLTDSELYQAATIHKTRLICFVILIVFIIEFLTHFFYSHSIVDVLRAFMSSGDSRYNDDQY